MTLPTATLESDIADGFAPSAEDHALLEYVRGGE